jgi:hypothetical protein
MRDEAARLTEFIASTDRPPAIASLMTLKHPSKPEYGTKNIARQKFGCRIIHMARESQKAF